MAQVTGGGDGNKLNVDLNLVPFIDLLSMLVLFLLLSVVWVQVGAIQTGVEKGGAATVTPVKENKLVVQVKANGYAITWPASARGPGFPKSLKKIEDIGPAVKNLLAKSGGKPPQASVAGDDKVEYGRVIEALDTLKTQGITLVGISTE